MLNDLKCNLNTLWESIVSGKEVEASWFTPLTEAEWNAQSQELDSDTVVSPHVLLDVAAPLFIDTLRFIHQQGWTKDKAWDIARTYNWNAAHLFMSSPSRVTVERVNEMIKRAHGIKEHISKVTC